MAGEVPWFEHEKLVVYQETVAFVAWLSAVLEEVQRAGDIKDQLERASSSIALNIAEGNGKFTAKDRCRYFDHGPRLRSRMRRGSGCARRPRQSDAGRDSTG
jgi:hypothetical protein